MNFLSQNSTKLLRSLIYPSREKEILDEVYKKYNPGLLIMAYMAILGQTYFAIYDYQNRDYYSTVVRILNFFLCVPYILFFNKINNFSKVDWHLLLVTFFYWSEVEVEIYSTGSPYHDPSTWLMIPLLILYHAFYFKSTTLNFIKYWSVLLVYYYFRVALSPVSSFDSPELLGVIKFLIPAFIFSSIFNFLWTQSRYTNQLYFKNLEREIARRVEIEKELATQLVRESIVDDIHDHLGSAILDMKWKILGIMEELPDSPENMKRIQNSLYQIEDALRMNINSMSDFKAIKEDFFFGIKIILFRRYEIFRRQARIYLEGLEPGSTVQLSNTKLVQLLYYISMELCSFDLKYGIGISKWKWFFDGDLNLDFQAQSLIKNDASQKRIEMIRERVLDIKGTYSESPDNEGFHCKIRLPQDKL